MDLKRLYRELVRRNVFRAVVAYLAVAWVLVQIADTIFPAFDAPSYLMQGLIYLLAIGLVIWTAFSWIYDLTPEGIQKTSEDSDSSQTRKLNSRRLNAVIVGAGIAAVLLLLAGGFWAGSQWKEGMESTGPSGLRIAVLPFENRSENAEYEYLREGLAEDIIGRLVNARSVSVISSKSSFRFRDDDLPVDQICKNLSADMVLTGSFELTGQRIAVKTELIRGEDQEIVSFASMDGELSQIRDISNGIRNHIFEALGQSDAQMQGNAIASLPEVNLEAYKYNALGQSAMRDNTGQKLEEITRYFQAAIDLDPDYIDPYIGMAEAYIFDVNRGYISTTEGAGKARKYALEAEKLNPGCGEVSCLMGIIHFLEFDFRNALPYFEMSLEKTPNYNLSYHWYAFTLEILGDFEEAEKYQKKAAVLDPLNAMNEAYLIMNYIFRKKYDSAGALINSRLSLEPNHKQTLWLKAFLLAEQGQFEEAHKTFMERGLGLETNFVYGYILGRQGQIEGAHLVLENMLKRPFISPAQLAIVYCGLGRYNDALDQVEEAFLIHDGWIKWVIYSSMTDPIKKDPRYISIITRLGLN